MKLLSVTFHFFFNARYFINQKITVPRYKKYFSKSSEEQQKIPHTLVLKLTFFQCMRMCEIKITWTIPVSQNNKKYVTILLFYHLYSYVTDN